MKCVLLDTGVYECREFEYSDQKFHHPLPPWAWIVIITVVMISLLIAVFFVVLHKEKILQLLDTHCPYLLFCFELKDGNRRFSLDPTRDTNHLPFTPEHNIHQEPSNTNNQMETNMDDFDGDGETWSSSDSARDSTLSRPSTKHLGDVKNNYNQNLNADSANTLNEIRSDLIGVMDAVSINSDSSSHRASPSPIRNPKLRVETRPPPCKHFVLTRIYTTKLSCWTV